MQPLVNTWLIKVNPYFGYWEPILSWHHASHLIGSGYHYQLPLAWLFLTEHVLGGWAWNRLQWLCNHVKKLNIHTMLNVSKQDMKCLNVVQYGPVWGKQMSKHLMIFGIVLSRASSALCYLLSKFKGLTFSSLCISLIDSSICDLELFCMFGGVRIWFNRSAASWLPLSQLQLLNGF